MNKSLRRVEKLVDATNSALAQIKSSLTFDDWSRKAGTGAEGDLVSRTPHVYSSRPQEFQHLDYGFKWQANKMLSDMEKLLNSNKISYSRTDGSRVSRAHSKMKEINEKIVGLKSKESAGDETKQSRGKLLKLTNEELHGAAATGGSQKESGRNKEIFPVECERSVGKESFVSESENLFPSNRKPKEELKNKILETQEIVDRGFHTARQLTQKVGGMSKPEIRCEKTSSSGSAAVRESRDLKTLNWSRKSRSLQALEVVNSRKRCRHHVGKEKQNRGSEKKNVVVKVKRADWREATVPQLKFQRLPSLHIKGGLQLQTIHNLEILPENSETISLKTNTGINILSHEKIKKENKEKMEKENGFTSKGESLESALKCCNCGKLINVQEGLMDSREIDKVLLDCNFNVFDPRIEEFVEKWNRAGGGVADGFFLEEKGENVSDRVGQHSENKESRETKSLNAFLNERRTDSPDKRLKIQELIEELSKKCKERVNNLEDDHLRLESILRNLCDKVSRSKEYFHVCKLLSFSEKAKGNRRKVRNLSATTPVVICLAGDADFSQLPVSNVLDTLTVKHTREKLDEKAEARKSTGRKNTGDRRHRQVNREEKEMGNKRQVEESEKEASKKSAFSPVDVFEVRDVETEGKGVESEKGSLSGRSKKDSPLALARIRYSPSRKTENHYESDFEEESSGEGKGGESEKEIKHGFNISKNSEFEKRFNDLNEREKWSNNEKISSGVNEVARVAHSSLQDPRNALKTPEWNLASLPSSPSPNPNVSNESGNSKAKSIESSARIKNNSSPKSRGGERRKSRSVTSLPPKSCSTEVVASLKEILTALNDQFARTQLLADKLTENVKDLSDEKERKSTRAEVFFTRGNATVSCDLSPRDRQKQIKDLNDGNKCSSSSKTTEGKMWKQEKVDERNSFSESNLSEGVSWEEEVSSVGEVNINNFNTSISVSCQKRRNPEKSRKCFKSEDGFTRMHNRRESCLKSSTNNSGVVEKKSASVFSLESRRGETYSEGEIESHGLTESECLSTHSIGEIISGFMSASSIME